MILTLVVAAVLTIIYVARHIPPTARMLSRLKAWYVGADIVPAPLPRGKVGPDPPSEILHGLVQGRIPLTSESQVDQSDCSSSLGTLNPKTPCDDGSDPRSHSDDDSDDDDDKDLPAPLFPAMNSAQRAAGTRNGPFNPTRTSKSSEVGSMPPPARRANLDVPHTSPAPNRVGRQQRPQSVSNSLAVPLQAPIPTQTSRNKVILSAGHSPLDWANLQRSGTNLSGVPALLRVAPSLLKKKNGRTGEPAWTSYQGRVYNVTAYLPFHPGGEGELRRAAGKDGEKLFMEVHPWVNWENMLQGCLVGFLVSEHDPKAVRNV